MRECDARGTRAIASMPPISRARRRSRRTMKASRSRRPLERRVTAPGRPVATGTTSSTRTDRDDQAEEVVRGQRAADDQRERAPPRARAGGPVVSSRTSKDVRAINAPRWREEARRLIEETIDAAVEDQPELAKDIPALFKHV